MKKVLVIGGKGMLGHKLVQQLAAQLRTWTTLHGTFSEVERFGIFDERPHYRGCRCHRYRFRSASCRDSTAGRCRQCRWRDQAIAGLSRRRSHASDQFDLSASACDSSPMNSDFALFTSAPIVYLTGKRETTTKTTFRTLSISTARASILARLPADNCLTLRTSIIGRELSGSHSLVEWFLSNRGKTVKGFVNAIYSGFPTVVFADIISSLIIEHADLSGLVSCFERADRQIHAA